MQNDVPKCPNCGNEIYFCLDEWGHTPFHLHCDNCDINIGATSFNKCIELLKDHHKPKTYIEYYHKEIKFLFENNELKIKETKLNAE